MGTVIDFPCRSIAAANDANPRLADESAPAVDTSRPPPVYARPCRVHDQASGVVYDGYTTEPERKPRGRVWLFLLGMVAWWLILF